MNSTEVLIAVTTPSGKPATINQLAHAIRMGAVDHAEGGYSQKHVNQLQQYVDEVKPGRPVRPAK